MKLKTVSSLKVILCFLMSTIHDILVLGKCNYFKESFYLIYILHFPSYPLFLINCFKIILNSHYKCQNIVANIKSQIYNDCFVYLNKKMTKHKAKKIMDTFLFATRVIRFYVINIVLPLFTHND